MRLVSFHNLAAYCVGILVLILQIHAKEICTYSVPKDTPQKTVWPEDQVITNRAKKIPPDVFILTMPRSGSTFVGELFLRNDNFIYIFEPFKPFQEVLSSDQCNPEPPQYAGMVIRDAYQCNFIGVKRELDIAYWKSGEISLQWDHIAQISSPNVKLCLQKESSRNETNKQKSIVVKEISQVFWSPKLKWLHANVGDPLKIVWLVRDVRGWVSTWTYKNGAFYYSKEWKMNKINLWAPYEGCAVVNNRDYFSEEEVETFSGYMKDLNAPIHLRMAAWWIVETRSERYYLSQIPTSDYMLFQYEHMSLFPISAVQELYHFLGMSSVPESLLRWVDNSTQGAKDDNRYSTARDSKAMASIYLKRLDAEQLLDIEELAKDDFEFFGYKRVTAPRNSKN